MKQIFFWTALRDNHLQEIKAAHYVFINRLVWEKYNVAIERKSNASKVRKALLFHDEYNQEVSTEFGLQQRCPCHMQALHC